MSNESLGFEGVAAASFGEATQSLKDDPRHTYDLRPRFEAFEREFDALKSTVTRIEAKFAGLEARLNAEKGSIPMDRGMKLFPEGDSIPSRSQHDMNDGKTYIVDGVALAFVKNTTQRYLAAGDSYRSGKIDTKLRSAHVEPNNFAYLEF